MNFFFSLPTFKKKQTMEQELRWFVGACEMGDKEEVERFIKENPGFSFIKNRFKHSPLIIALWGSHWKIAWTLLESHIKGDLVLDLMYIQSPQDENGFRHEQYAFYANGATAFHYACAEDDLKSVKFMVDILLSALDKSLEAPFDPNKQNADGLSPLHVACILRRYEMIRYLFEKPFINRGLITAKGETMLMHFIKNDAPPEIIKSLIESKEVNSSHRDALGDTALHNACQFDNEYAVRLLLEHLEIADLNLRNDDGKTPFLIACSRSKPGLIKLLLEREEIDRFATTEYTDSGAVHEAADNRNRGVMRLLFENGAIPDVNAKNQYRNKAINHACFNGFKDTLLYLLREQSAEVNLDDIEEVCYVNKLRGPLKCIELLLLFCPKERVFEDKDRVSKMKVMLMGNPEFEENRLIDRFLRDPEAVQAELAKKLKLN